MQGVLKVMHGAYVSRNGADSRFFSEIAFVCKYLRVHNIFQYKMNSFCVEQNIVAR